MRFASLFAGIGGFDLALSRAGFDCAWQCEIDPACRSVLAAHWPSVRRYEDVRTVGAGAPAVDVLCGGWPCQDLSVAGRRAGLAGERSGLFVEIVRLARVLAPRWLLLENVPGLLSSHGGRDMGAVLGALGECGYRWAYRVLDAQHFGVPQRRRRVFIVGCLGDGRPEEVLFEPEGVQRDSPAGEGAGARVAALSARGVGVGGADDNQAQAGHLIAGTLAFGAHPGGVTGREAESGLLVFDETQITSRENRCNPQIGAPSHPLASSARPPTVAQSPEWDAGGVLSPIDYLSPEGADASEDGTGEGTPLVFNWQSGGDCRLGISGRAVGALHGVRRLTPREAERLQGLPDDWTRFGADGKELSDSARYRMIGNSVAVPVVQWLAERLVGSAVSGASKHRRAERP